MHSTPDNCSALEEETLNDKMIIGRSLDDAKDCCIVGKNITAENPVDNHPSCSVS
jgi:hypothetical protein